MRACRGCGCTDAQSCAEGCSWVDEDLCSSCQGRVLAAHPLIAEPLGIELPMHGWLAIHGNLLLALRHPANRGGSRTIVEDLVGLLEGAFLDAGLLTERQLEVMHQHEDAARAEAEERAPRIIIPGA